MPTVNTKYVFRYLHYDTDFMQEESFLDSMGREGYILTGVMLNSLYRFRKTQPCSLVYKMDFRDTHDIDYLQLVLDAGWLLAATRRGRNGICYYFYRTNDNDSVTELFTDNESRLDFFRRTQKRALLSMIILIMVFLIGVTSRFLFNHNSHILGFIAGFATGLSLVFFVISAIIFRKTQIKIKQITDNEL